MMGDVGRNVFLKEGIMMNRPQDGITRFLHYTDLFTNVKCVYYLRNRPWRPIDVFPVRCEHYLHIKQ
jgi:hypothetical protein